MITERKLRSLKPLTNLYRVIESTKKGKSTYTCCKATIDKTGPKTVSFIENTRATSHGKRQTIEWVTENMSISREGAWDRAYTIKQAELLADGGRIKLIHAGIVKMRAELDLIRNRGKR